MNYFISRDIRNPQSRSQFYGESESEQLVGAFPIELVSFNSIDVGKDEIDRILGKGVERRVRRNDVSKESMILFNVRFLVRSIRIAEPFFKFCVNATLA